MSKRLGGIIACKYKNIARVLVSANHPFYSWVFPCASLSPNNLSFSGVCFFVLFLVVFVMFLFLTLSSFEAL